MSTKLKTEKLVELESDNKFYEPYEVSVGDIREIWYVRAKISPFLPSPGNIQNNLHDKMNQLASTVAKQSKLINNLTDTINKLVDKQED